MNDFLMRW